jgi:hypothetical protein
LIVSNQKADHKPKTLKPFSTRLIHIDKKRSLIKGSVIEASDIEWTQQFHEDEDQGQDEGVRKFWKY